MAVSIGPKLGIDGEAEYRKQINQIIQQAKTLKSEMDAVASSFTKETTAEEKNRATKAVLTKQIEAQEQKTKLLAHMVEEAAKATGENSTETLKWKDQLNKATAELGKMNWTTVSMIPVTVLTITKNRQKNSATSWTTRKSRRQTLGTFCAPTSCRI